MPSHIVTTRVALGDLAVNLQPSQVGENLSQLSSTTSEKCRAENTANSSSTPQKPSNTVVKSTFKNNKLISSYEENRFSGIKRSFEAVDGFGDVSPHRQLKKTNNFELHISASKPVLAEDSPAGLVFGERLQSNISRQYQRNVGSPASESATPDSPASSFGGSNSSALNDSQNTVITEPDSPTSRVIAPGQLREKARAMKLRLRLAAYKVQSNQMDIPISQLRIKAATPPSPKLPILPRHPTSASTAKRRTPLPSVPPSIEIQKPSADTPRSLANIPSSPPLYNPSEALISPLKEAFDTPLVPRRRGLLNPQGLGSPTWKDRELTSSAVKGKAADSLLSLMRQQC